MSGRELSRRKLLAAASFAGVVAALPAWADTDDSEARLAAFFEKIFQDGLDRSPIRQSGLGIRRDQDKWDDVSEARAIEGQARVKAQLAQLRGFDAAKLSPGARISYRMFERNCDRAIENFPLRRDDYVLTQMGGMHTRIPITLLNNHPIATSADADAYVKRIAGVETLLDQVLDAVRRQEAAGVKPPKFVYPLVIEPCANMLRGKPFDAGPADCPVLGDFRAKIAKANLPEPEQAALTARAVVALTGPFAMGYRKLIVHLQASEATADTRDGVWKLPQGDLFYRQQLEGFTTLKLSPDAIHEMGLAAVARIHGEMLAIARGVGFKGTLQAFFEHCRTDPRFFYEDSDAGRAQYIADAERLLDEIRGRQGEFFRVFPKAKVEVRAVEKWREKSAPKASYTNPPADGSRPGIFYVNLYDVKAQPKWQLPVTLYHEAIPGHHFETCIAHEMQGLPKFRRFASIAAFSEGWGLYCERLPKEIGLYQDPYDDFGRLSLELMRACRLVVDTGIHAKRWSREKAVAYMDANMPSSHYDNQREIDRYVVYPGQACSYYIGMQKILDLRAGAEKALGAKFDLRDFHDLVLGNGPLPLPILEEVVTEWVATRRAAA